MIRFLRRGLAGLGIVCLLCAAAVAGIIWRTLPDSRHIAQAPGLQAAADIAFDPHGIPWIHAGTERDAIFALGYAHARDRAFQMELMRRTASGRLSEFAGTATLKLDKLMRTLGLRRRAEQDFDALPAGTRDLLQAYARGVNTRFQEQGRFAAPEFLVLGAPEPWLPVDSLLWGKTMTLFLSGNYRAELARMELTSQMPRDRILELWPATGQVPSVDAALSFPRLAQGEHDQAAGDLLAALPKEGTPFTLPSTASNEWAVDGAHSATGAPLLAGDPHLSFGLPGLWYLARIDTPDGSLAGATAPGMPFLVVGHNGHVAWTFTTSAADTQDLFVETELDPGHYATPEGPQPYVTRQETILVRGADSVALTVRETRHGPVISDLSGRSGPVIALAATGLQPGDTAAAGLAALNHARTVQEAGRTAALITSPVQNLLAADRQGIGVFTTGRIPLRRSGDGSWPVAGADGAHDWTGMAAGEALPHAAAPASGRLVNANERLETTDGKESSTFMGRDGFGTWRARRIRQMLDGAGHPGVMDFTAMQTDQRSLFAAGLLPRLRLVTVDGDAGKALALLADWNGDMAAASPAPLIFNAWMDRFRAAVLARAHVPEGNAAVLPLELTAWLLTDAGASWCDAANCTPLLAQTLREAVAQLAALYGPDPTAWHWGEAHQAVFQNPLLHGIPLLSILGRSAIAIGGDDSTVGRAGTAHAVTASRALAEGDFDDTHGASYRGVYDLADLARSRFAVAPGQTGNPFSRHARDRILSWRDGETLTLGPEPPHIEATVHLIPATAP